MAGRWWSLASAWHPDKPDRRAPSHNALLYASFCLMPCSLSHSLFTSPGFWCCFLLLEKQRQQPCLWVEIISFRWKPCAVSVCDFHAFISLEGSHAALQVEAILQPSSSKLCQNRVNETSWNKQLIRLLQFRPGWWTQRSFHMLGELVGCFSAPAHPKPSRLCFRHLMLSRFPAFRSNSSHKAENHSVSH